LGGDVSIDGLGRLDTRDLGLHRHLMVEGINLYGASDALNGAGGDRIGWFVKADAALFKKISQSLVRTT
jgi:hypothetical protein